MDTDTDFDLAANKKLTQIIIETLQAIVDIENMSLSGNKPVLSKLKKALIEAYGLIKMSQYALAKN